MSETRDPSTDQPLPTPSDRPAVWEAVIDDMRARDQLGRKKYGTARTALKKEMAVGVGSTAAIATAESDGSVRTNRSLPRATEQVQKTMTEISHDAAVIGKQKKENDVDYLNQYIAAIALNQDFIDTRIDGANELIGLELARRCSDSERTEEKLWLSFVKGKPTLRYTRSKLVGVTATFDNIRDVSPEEVISSSLFNLDDDGFAERFDRFENSAKRKLEEMKNNLPKTDEQKRKRREFYAQLAKTAYQRHVEYTATANAKD